MKMRSVGLLQHQPLFLATYTGRERSGVPKRMDSPDMVKLCVQLASFPYNLLYDKQWKNATRFCMTFKAIQFALTPLNSQAFTVAKTRKSASSVKILIQTINAIAKSTLLTTNFLLDIR